MKSHVVLLSKLSVAQFALRCLTHELQKKIKEGKQNEFVEYVLRIFLNSTVIEVNVIRNYQWKVYISIFFVTESGCKNNKITNYKDHQWLDFFLDFFWLVVFSPLDSSNVHLAGCQQPESLAEVWWWGSNIWGRYWWCLFTKPLLDCWSDCKTHLSYIFMSQHPPSTLQQWGPWNHIGVKIKNVNDLTATYITFQKEW